MTERLLRADRSPPSPQRTALGARRCRRWHTMLRRPTTTDHLDSTRTREKSNEIGLICLRVARMFAKPKGEPGGVTSTNPGSDHTLRKGRERHG